jgi:hypothetical protein
MPKSQAACSARSVILGSDAPLSPRRSARCLGAIALPRGGGDNGGRDGPIPNTPLRLMGLCFPR